MIVPVYVAETAPNPWFDALSRHMAPFPYEWVPYSSWSDFSDASRDSLAAVALVADSRAELIRRVDDFRRRSPAALVLIGDRVPPSIVAAKLFGVVAIEARRIGVELPRAFHRMRAVGFLRGQAHDVERAGHLSPGMKRFVLTMLTADPPLQSVQTLARRCSRSRQDLYYHWRAEAGDSRPKRCLQWVLLVHAAMSWRPDTSWERVAKELRTDVRKLSRAARTLMDRSLGEVAGDGGHEVMAEFRAYLDDVLGLSARL